MLGQRGLEGLHRDFGLEFGDLSTKKWGLFLVSVIRKLGSLVTKYLALPNTLSLGPGVGGHGVGIEKPWERSLGSSCQPQQGGVVLVVLRCLCFQSLFRYAFRGPICILLKFSTDTDIL